jgi:hypothetical protein
MATSVGDVLGYLFKPPGWRPDGSGETTEELRRHSAGAPLRMRRESPTLLD